MRCANCGEIYWTEPATVTGPEFKDGLAVFTAKVMKYSVEYTDQKSIEPAAAERVEPSIDEAGRYVYGQLPHWELVLNGVTHYYDAESYAERTPEELRISYFEFEGGRIRRYTGPVDETVVLPAFTPEGTELTALGDNSRAFLSGWQTPVLLKDHGSITSVVESAFIGTQHPLILELSAKKAISVGNAAFLDRKSVV